MKEKNVEEALNHAVRKLPDHLANFVKMQFEATLNTKMGEGTPLK